jgi:hypothetical protein
MLLARFLAPALRRVRAPLVLFFDERTHLRGIRAEFLRLRIGSAFENGHSAFLARTIPENVKRFSGMRESESAAPGSQTQPFGF